MQTLKIRRYKPSDNPIVWELHKLGLAEIGAVPDRNSPWNQDFKNIEELCMRNFMLSFMKKSCRGKY